MHTELVVRLFFGASIIFNNDLTTVGAGSFNVLRLKEVVGVVKGQLGPVIEVQVPEANIVLLAREVNDSKVMFVLANTNLQTAKFHLDLKDLGRAFPDRGTRQWWEE